MMQSRGKNPHRTGQMNITAQRALAASALAAEARIAGADIDALLDRLDQIDNENTTSERLAWHIEAIRHTIEA